MQNNGTRVWHWVIPFFVCIPLYGWCRPLIFISRFSLFDCCRLSGAIFLHLPICNNFFIDYFQSLFCGHRYTFYIFDHNLWQEFEKYQIKARSQPRGKIAQIVNTKTGSHIGRGVAQVLNVDLAFCKNVLKMGHEREPKSNILSPLIGTGRLSAAFCTGTQKSNFVKSGHFILLLETNIQNS